MIATQKNVFDLNLMIKHDIRNTDLNIYWILGLTISLQGIESF